MNDPLQDVLVELQARSLTLATAESLTGGALASRIVDVPGASNCFLGGVVTYAVESKSELLGVSSDLLRAGGPVQADVAAQMAAGAARLFRADVGVSTTGVAGPGDSPDGPCGRVYVGVSLGSELVTEAHSFVGDRGAIRSQSVDAALALLWRLLRDLPEQTPGQ